jgi:large subunit ribosomal protein L21
MVGGEAPVIGQPTVKNAKVTCVVTKQTRDRKVIIFKKKRRQGYRRFKTHRQHFTELFVKAISLDGKTAKTDTRAKVIDVDQARKDRIVARSENPATKTAASALEKAAKKAAAKATPKKAAKKPAKKAGPAKKKTAAKKK